MSYNTVNRDDNRILSSTLPQDVYVSDNRRSSRNSTERGEEWQRKGGRNISFDQRVARHSTGAKEEFLAPEMGEEPQPLAGKDPKMLAIYFGLMVFIGLGNKIFNKLMTIPMHSKAYILRLA